MQKSEEIEKDFRTELKKLLEKYNAKIEAEDHYSGYPECGEDIHMTVYIKPVYLDGNCIMEYTEIDLGQYFS